MLSARFISWSVTALRVWSGSRQTASQPAVITPGQRNINNPSPEKGRRKARISLHITLLFISLLEWRSSLSRPWDHHWLLLIETDLYAVTFCRHLYGLALCAHRATMMGLGQRKMNFFKVRGCTPYSGRPKNNNAYHREPSRSCGIQPEIKSVFVPWPSGNSFTVETEYRWDQCTFGRSVDDDGYTRQGPDGSSFHLALRINRNRACFSTQCEPFHMF